MSPVGLEQRADPWEVADQERFRHPLGDIAETVEGAGHRPVATLVRLHDPADGGAREARGPGVHEDHPPCELIQESRIEREPLDRGVGVAEAQPEETAIRRRELVLPPTGYPGLHSFQPARQARKLGNLERLAACQGQRPDQGDIERTRAPSPDPEGASDRVVSVHGPTGSMRSPACRSDSGPAGSRADSSGTSRLPFRSSATSRRPLPPGRTSAWAYSSIAAETTTPPSRDENGGTSVQPPARSRRTGAAARNTLTGRPTSRARWELTPEIHSDPVHPSVHPLQPSSVVQHDHGERIGEHPLRPSRIGRGGEARDGGERSEIREPRVARHTEDGGIEVVRGPVHPRQKGGQLELADPGVHAGAPQASLDHLLERRLTAADGQQLEPEWRPAATARVPESATGT